MAPRSRSHGPTEAPRPKKKFATGFRCYPTNRDAVEKSAQSWMEGKRIDDDVGSYWRVHDKIYDLEKFIDKHPGGKASGDGYSAIIFHTFLQISVRR